MANYCYKKLRDLKFNVLTLTAQGFVLGQLEKRCLYFHTQPDCDGRTLLWKSKDWKVAFLLLQGWEQCLVECPCQRGDEYSHQLMAEIPVRLLFILKLCHHLHSCFLEDELKEWSMFDTHTLSSEWVTNWTRPSWCRF